MIVTVAFMRTAGSHVKGRRLLPSPQIRDAPFAAHAQLVLAEGGSGHARDTGRVRVVTGSNRSPLPAPRGEKRVGVG